MKIVAISDTHCRHPELPEGDVLVHAGDLTIAGNRKETEAEVRWLGEESKKYKWVVLTGGNHDWFFYHAGAKVTRQFISEFGSENIVYLCDDSVGIDGVHFYGSPWQPWFYDWAWNAQRGPELAKIWSLIPDDTDVLVTHGPPMDILDWVGPRHVGCEDLARRVGNMPDLKAHIFGHIHSAGGKHWEKFYNAAVVDEAYKLAHEPHIIEL